MNILLLLGLWFHPFYVSVMELNHNARASSMELTIRCFADDLEDCLRQQNTASKPNLVEMPRSAATDSLVSRYVKQHLLVMADGKKLDFQFVGAEMSEGSFWIFLEAGKVPAPKTVVVQNNFLYECRKEQTNLHHFTVNGQRQSYKLDNPANRFQLNF